MNRDRLTRMAVAAVVCVAGARLPAAQPATAPAIEKDFFVTLPEQNRPIPEPLPDAARPGFKIRGTKGWNWAPQQYLAEIPVLARAKMNFLMNCYLSMFDHEHAAWASGQANWFPTPGYGAPSHSQRQFRVMGLDEEKEYDT